MGWVLVGWDGLGRNGVVFDEMERNVTIEGGWDDGLDVM